MADRSAPALPWGAAASSQAPADEQAVPVPAPAESDATIRIPSTGERIEVKWRLDHDDGTSTSMWWGARVDGMTGRRDAEGREVWRLWYDAYDEFPEEEAAAAFLPGGWLKDEGQEAPLLWRREGEDFDIEEGEEEEEEEEEALPDVVDYAHIQRMQAELEAALGKPMEQAALDAMAAQHLTPARQLQVMEGFRSFVDHVKGQLGERVRSAGDGSGSGSGGYLVTEEDVNAIVGQWRKK